VQVASELSAALTEQQTINIQKSKTENVKAFELYQLGRHHWGMRTHEGLKTSIIYFEQAIEEDSTYALAYAGLADTYYLMCLFDHVDNKKSNRDKALELANKALELDNRLTEAYTVIATIYSFIDWNWEAAEEAFMQGLEDNPNFSNIHHRYSEHLSATVRHEEARQHINKALELDPLSFIVRYVSAKLYYNQGLFKEARAEIQICNDLMMNKFHWFIHDMNFELNYHAGNTPALLKNLRIVEDKYGISKPGNIDSIYTVSSLKGIVNYRAELDSDPFYKARFYGLSGDDEKAIGWLEKAFEDKRTEVDLPYLYNFRKLHSNPRYIALLKKMNLPWKPDSSQ
jgi:tetratricopeptide (TPR) repeat protein